MPNIEPQKGAVCTQALINPLYGPHGLRLIREGVGAADVVRILTTPDAGREHRQLHVMGADGRSPPTPAPNACRGAATGSARTCRSPATCWPDPQVVSETVRFFRENASTSPCRAA